MTSKNKIIRTTKRFDKSFIKCDKKIQEKTKDRLKLFLEDSFDPLLHNHPLTGEWRWFRSIDVTGDFRIIFVEYDEWIYEIVELAEIATHSQLYK